jgi:hypothetical protein
LTTLAKARIVNYDRQSDAPNCSVTYDRHYDDHNSFIIQATGVFATVSLSRPSLIFAGAYMSGACYGLHSNCRRLLALPANIRLEWRLLTVTNTLAYYDLDLITTISDFIVQALRNFYLSCHEFLVALEIKPFGIIRALV